MLCTGTQTWTLFSNRENEADYPSDVTGLKWLTFTPLSLLHRLHLLVSKLLSQFNELDTPESFGEDIC